MLQDYEPAPKAEDGRDYELKVGRFGQFWAHPDYPKVKDAKPLVMKRDKFVETYGIPPQTDDGRDYLIKKGRFGFFWAHPDYPKVKDIKKLEKQPARK
jgi:ssDNA-binding Zn-finger/Zn-ribbon topoisomerase 1